MKRAASLAVIASFALASSSVADEVIVVSGDGTITDRSTHTRQMDLSLMAWLPWYYGFGIGVDGRFSIPIVPDGFIPQINDEFDIEPSLGLAYSTYGLVDTNYNYFNITPAVYGIWAFHFSHKFRAYGGLGLGVNIGVVSGNACNGCGISPTYFYWDPVIGLNWRFIPAMALRAEAGAQGLKGGISIYF
jgi:hypothetical protein